MSVNCGLWESHVAVMIDILKARGKVRLVGNFSLVCMCILHDQSDFLLIFALWLQSKGDKK